MKPWKHNPCNTPEALSDPQWPIYTAAEQSPQTPAIDLHQEHCTDDASAMQAVRSFLEHEQAQGRRIEDKVVRIIHGRGYGRLKNKTHDLLNSMRQEKESYILDWRDSTRPGETGGVTYVRLAPNAR